MRQLAVALCAAVLLVNPVRAVSPSGTAEIRGYVWQDDNENGSWDAGERVLPDVLIVLADSTGAMLGYTQTNGAGEYRFSALPTGSYYVSETDPEGFGSTTPNLVAVTLESEASLRQDFGDTRMLPGCWHRVDGYVWYDANANGRRDEGEARLQGVSARVLDLEGNLVAITASNGSYGAYTMLGLTPERYRVILDAPSDYPYSRAPLYWGVDLRGCAPAIIDFGLQRRLEASWACSSTRDVVGPGNNLLGPDGLRDGAIEIRLNADTLEPLDVTGVLVDAQGFGQGRRWDTDPSTADWVVGVVAPQTNQVLNPEVTVRRTFTASTSLLLCISDVPGSAFLRPSTAVTVTVQAASGDAWLAGLTIPTCTSGTLAAAPGDEGNCAVSGVVWTVDPVLGRRAAAGVRLTLVDASDTSGSTTFQQLTDSAGHYRFGDLPGWRAYYLTQPLLDGYEPVLSAYWGVAMTDSSDVLIDLENRPTPGTRVYQVSLPYLTAHRTH
jgi:hypothetical protein